MKVETILGAVIAALVLFISSIVTLFTENPELTLQAIKQSTWISIGGGALVAFLKDYQAVRSRQFLSNITKSGNVHIVGPFVAIFAALMLAGCGVQHPKVDSVEDAVVVASANIETVADQVHDLCGNQEPGGACLSGALITTETKDRLKRDLQQALNLTVGANEARMQNRPGHAEDLLARAASLLAVVERILEEVTQ